jgi:hypothetical protein
MLRQVIIGFVTTSYLTLLVLIFYYLFSFDPESAGFSGVCNPIDRAITQWVRSRPRFRISPDWGDALEKVSLLSLFYAVILTFQSVY